MSLRILLEKNLFNHICISILDGLSGIYVSRKKMHKFGCCVRKKTIMFWNGYGKIVRPGALVSLPIFHKHLSIKMYPCIRHCSRNCLVQRGRVSKEIYKNVNKSPKHSIVWVLPKPNKKWSSH